ncbi:hypothetical protein H0H93_007288, partial [Arthromyces matolae]
MDGCLSMYNNPPNSPMSSPTKFFQYGQFFASGCGRSPERHVGTYVLDEYLEGSIRGEKVSANGANIFVAPIDRVVQPPSNTTTVVLEENALTSHACLFNMLPALLRNHYGTIPHKSFISTPPRSFPWSSFLLPPPTIFSPLTSSHQPLVNVLAVSTNSSRSIVTSGCGASAKIATNGFVGCEWDGWGVGEYFGNPQRASSA